VKRSAFLMLARGETLPCYSTGRRCKSHGRIDTELSSQVNECEKYWKSLLPAKFGFCHKIYC